MSLEGNTNDKISIIVPIYNSQKFLKNCIESIVNQSYKDLEIILINDGSTDNSEKICKNTVDIDNRVLYYYQHNTGVSAARNKGISLSTGKYIMFVDSDDYVDKTMCEKLLFQVKNHCAELAICGYVTEYYVDESLKNSIVTIPNIKNICNKQDVVCKYPLLFNKKIMMSPWIKLYNTHILIKNNITFNINIELGEDILFNFEYFKFISKIACVNEALYNYRVNKKHSSLTKKYTKYRIDNAAFILDKSLEFASQVGIVEHDKSIFSKWYYKNCMLTIENLLKSEERKNIKNEIKKIFISKATYKANLIKIQKKDLELIIYAICFRLKNYNLILIIIYIRILIKKIIRG